MVSIKSLITSIIECAEEYIEPDDASRRDAFEVGPMDDVTVWMRELCHRPSMGMIARFAPHAEAAVGLRAVAWAADHADKPRQTQLVALYGRMLDADYGRNLAAGEPDITLDHAFAGLIYRRVSPVAAEFVAAHATDDWAVTGRSAKVYGFALRNAVEEAQTRDLCTRLATAFVAHCETLVANGNEAQAVDSAVYVLDVDTLSPAAAVIIKRHKHARWEDGANAYDRAVSVFPAQNDKYLQLLALAPGQS